MISILKTTLSLAVASTIGLTPLADAGTDGFPAAASTTQAPTINTAISDYPDPPTPGANAYPGPCGLLFCSIEFSRHYTKYVLQPAAAPGGTAVTAAVTGACALSGVGTAATAGCGAGAAIVSAESVAAINQAAANDQCAVLVWEQAANVLSWFRTDNDYCID